MNTLTGGFKYRYSQSFLDKLAKNLGIKWTKVKFETINKKNVPIVPLSPPNGELYYLEFNYKS